MDSSEAEKIAKTIATKSPIAVQGSKISLNQMRDANIRDGLRFIQTWNMSALQSEDVAKAGMAVATKSDAPEFEDV
ncbi:delta(3:5)-Delta(2:4)-dienoyl-CoA isomerase-like protein [Leptotrombidium deliense]|uniref:Delta(3:5)-Delta(2:4)-dienoyl-CoA isomerase-like protein n=1 Tax=Leptotrombidium deliense TaxID=299467 RepID=A0A443RUV8_9ACAR|nr:delta(3:5)-Delta(2:4)-dienoyl-CoA isomerase-like protein [Leptotrombidium deliense]